MDVLLNRIFTEKELNNLLTLGTMKYAKKAANRYNIISHTLKEQLQNLYKFLAFNHRNEYFYKNELLNKIVLGKHSVNTTSALRELPIYNSIADFIIINGKAQVYEIKTELDTLKRLDSQLNNYYKAFEYVNVITDKKYAEKIKDYINPNIGIFTLTSRNEIHTVRKAKKYNRELNSKVMFRILRKPEFEKLILKKYGYLPKVGASKYYEANYELFRKLSKEEQQKELTFILKQRYFLRFKGKGKLLMDSPRELRELIYFSSLNDENIEKINKILKLEEI